jgi:hypothetical protein
MNDLWKYSPQTGEWTWISGDKKKNANAHYGEKGKSQRDNDPGARQAAVNWKDNQGNFWLYGGEKSSAILSDLWKFDRELSEWVWINGDKKTNQPHKHFNNNNQPGGRSLSPGWTDGSNNLWLFGGHGFDENGNKGSLNSVWKYSIENDQWTLVKGNLSINVNPVYGIAGSASAISTPGGMYNAAAWKDAKGDPWIFGGQNNIGLLNGLWKFSSCTAGARTTITPDSASICKGSTQTLTAIGGSSFQWLRNGENISGETGSTITVSTAGMYSVIVKDDGCSASSANSAKITELDATGVRYADLSTSANVAIQLTTRVAGQTYEWLPFNGLDDPNSRSPKAILQEDVTYTVQIVTEQ